MRAQEFIIEGGWDNVATQQTILTPKIVQAALAIVKQFTADFNQYLESVGVAPVRMGAPLGSTAYHDVDEPDKEYGDIDLQMIAPEIPGKTPNQATAFYNKQVDDFNRTVRPDYIHDPDKPAKGHIIINLGEAYVQVDLLWATEAISDWARWRTTPERGVKGLISGNMFSALGEIMGISIQQAGAQLKVKDGNPVNFQRTRKVDRVDTISTDISNYGVDILSHFYENIHGSLDNMQIDPELQRYPGLNKQQVKVSDLAHVVKGLAKSFELNDMYGKYILADHRNATEFIESFLAHFMDKAEKAKYGKKFDKAESPEALAKVQHTRDMIDQGKALVNKAFGL